MTKKRVVITGRGAVSPFGLGVPLLVENIWAGRSAVRFMPDWSSIKGLTSCIAAPVPDYDAKTLLPRNIRRTMGPMAQYATLASREAVEDAALSVDELASGETGVAIGTTTGSAEAYAAFFKKFLSTSSLSDVKSGEFFKVMGHSCSANVSLALGIRGEQWAPASACTSSSQAIGLGYLLIQAGRQKIMLCGGADEAHASVTGVFDLLRAASNSNDDPERGCRPFDCDRNGVVCGGGSGVLVLEECQAAKQRGAKIYGEIVGFGNVTDSGHIANPDRVSMAMSMERAMAEASLGSGDIDYVNAHATGTELGDIAEAAAISMAVDSTTPVSSMKGHIGHTLGAAGALELIIVLEMLARQQIVATRNIEKVDPRCAVARIETALREASLQCVLKNNFALGGVNTSLIINAL